MRFLLVPCVVGWALILGACTNTSAEKPLGEPIPNDQAEEERYYVPPASETGSSGSIYITADESLKPIVEAQIENFEAIYKEANVTAIYLPGELAIKTMVNEDSIRLVVGTRQLTEEEVNALKSRRISPRYAPIFRDGITVLAHPANPLETLTRTQLEGILSGKINQWQELQADGPQGEIRLVFDHAQSSTLPFLKDSFLMGTSLRQSQVFALQSTVEAIDYVANQPLALGFVGQAWLSDLDDPQTRDFLQQVDVIKLEKPDQGVPCAFEEQFFVPAQAFLDQECYPLTRQVYTILRETTFGLGTGFVSYWDGPVGQRLIHKAGLATEHTIPRVVRLPKDFSIKGKSPKASKEASAEK